VGDGLVHLVAADAHRSVSGRSRPSEDDCHLAGYRRRHRRPFARSARRSRCRRRSRPRSAPRSGGPVSLPQPGDASSTARFLHLGHTRGSAHDQSRVGARRRSRTFADEVAEHLLGHFEVGDHARGAVDASPRSSPASGRSSARRRRRTACTSPRVRVGPPRPRARTPRCRRPPTYTSVFAVPRSIAMSWTPRLGVR